jgi:hypothetical protein
MLIDGKELKILNLKDLNSKISFSKWINTYIENERQYTIYQIFESKRYIVYLNYILNNVLPKQPVKNKPDWIEAINKLIKEKENESR